MNTTYVETNQHAIQIGQPFKGGGQLQVGACNNARNHISIFTTKLFRLSKISLYL